jgi:hypothetical protein
MLGDLNEYGKPSAPTQEVARFQWARDQWRTEGVNIPIPTWNNHIGVATWLNWRATYRE